MNKQCLVDKNNRAENTKRRAHLYQEGNLVLLQKGTEHKYETPYKGPYRILTVNDNGTVCLKIGAVKDTINIRQITCILEKVDIPRSWGTMQYASATGQS